MLELKNIYKSYQLKNKKVEVLKDINLKFNNKGMTFILGKSGSGKTTLLNIIGGLDKYDSGYLIIDSKSTETFKNKDYDFYRNNYIGFIFQDNNLIEGYTVYENICLAVNLQSKKVNDKEIDELLNNLEISDLKSRKISELSGGQKGRVAIARALIKKPKIILADEPTGNLDTSTSREVMSLLKKISGDYLVIVVTHDIKCANIYGDRILEIKDGIITNDSNKVLEIENNIYEIKKSKLPLKDAFKLGFISLKNKKLKLFFTIFLITISSTLLLLSESCKNYNPNKSHFNLSSNLEFIEIKKFKYHYDEQTKKHSKVVLDIKNSDINNINKKITTNSVSYYLESTNTIDLLNLNIDDKDINDKYLDMYSRIPDTLTLVDEQVKTNLIGKNPTKQEEIVISNYLADLLIKLGIKDNLGIIKYNNYNDILNNKIIFNNDVFKVVGIINYDLSNYSDLKNKYFNKEYQNNNMRMKFFELKGKSNYIYNKVYVSSDYINSLKESTPVNLDSNNKYVINKKDIKLTDNNIDVLSKNVLYYDGTSFKNKDKLNTNEALISINSFVDSDYQEKLNSYILKYPSKDKLELEKEFLINNYDLSKFIGTDISLDIYLNQNDYYYLKTPDKTYKNIKIIGVTGLYYSDNHQFLLSGDLLNDYTYSDFKVSSLIVNNDFKKAFDSFKFNETYTVDTMYEDDINVLYDKLVTFLPVLNITVIVLSMFSIILILNLFFESIIQRKKDIGILKSLGSKNTDILKIFIFESIILVSITTLLSLLMLTISDKIIGFVLRGITNFATNPIYFDINTVLLIIIINIWTIFLAIIIPSIKIFNLKPIDAINNNC